MTDFGISVSIFLATYLAIVSEKISQTLCALVGGGLMIYAGILTQDLALKEFVDFNTLGLLAGMMVLIAIVRDTGFFEAMALWAVKKSKYPDSWKKKYREDVHFSLGLFLAQYLCNGFNLADAAELTYDEYYYATDGKAFRFERKKTRNRAENGAEVIIPIIEPLQNILNEIAAAPEPGALVFPQILMGATEPKVVRKNVSLANSNVQDRVICVCEKILRWEVRPSSTWCRHSFANNLKDAGVEREYISESMGHSTGKTVTDIYLDTYPLKKQFENNSKLLLPDNDAIDNSIEEMSKSDLEKLLKQKMGLSDEEFDGVLQKLIS